MIPEGEERLWQNVLLKASHDNDVDDWFSIDNPDFIRVCEYAGVMPCKMIEKVLGCNHD